MELNSPSGTADVYLGRDVDGLADQNLAANVRETREGIEDLYSTAGTVDDVVLPTGSAIRFTITENLFGPATHTIWFVAHGSDVWLLSFDNDGTLRNPNPR